MQNFIILFLWAVVTEFPEPVQPADAVYAYCVQLILS